MGKVQFQMFRTIPSVFGAPLLALFALACADQGEKVSESELAHGRERHAQACACADRPQLDCSDRRKGDIEVVFECDAVHVWSCKDLSNVVIETEDGVRRRFEGLSGGQGVFDAAEGKRIVRVWVKAGANHSGDGPGYGERFEAPADSCEEGNGGSGSGSGSGDAGTGSGTGSGSGSGSDAGTGSTGGGTGGSCPAPTPSSGTGLI